MSSSLPELHVDRVPVQNYLSRIITQWRSDPDRGVDFWSSAERPQSDATQEVVEFELNGVRAINYVALRTAHFPHTIWAEYQDPDTLQWLAMRSLVSSANTWDSSFFRPGPDGTAPVMEVGSPASFVITDSMPMKVSDGVALGYAHPQHFGHGHWIPVSWSLRPVHAKRVRLRLVRGAGVPPATSLGTPAAYSLGLRDVQIGYRVNARADIPQSTPGEDFASSIDLLGSRVLFSLKEDAATNAMNGDRSSFWRCDPQPVNYAVVNFYADCRDDMGMGQVIDRFFLDPLTPGPVVNLYYSNDDPSGTFEAIDEPLTYPVMQTFGDAQIPVTLGMETSFDSVSFSTPTSSVQEARRNYLSNDSFEVDLTGWWEFTQCVMTRSNVISRSGSYSMAVTNSQNVTADTGPQWGVGTDGVPCAPGDVWTASMYFSAASSAPARTVAVYLAWFDAAGNRIADVSGDPAIDLPDGTWVRASVTATAPANAAFVGLIPYVYGMAPNETHYLDDGLLEKSNALREHFNGDTTDTGAYTYGWVGTPNESQSVQTETVLTVNPSFVDIDNAYLQLDLMHPLWVGMEMRATTNEDGLAGGVTDHPLLSIGTNVLRINGGNIEFIADNGQTVAVALDPQHTIGTRFSVALVLNPNGTGAGDYLDGASLVYQLDNLPPVSTTLALSDDALGMRPGTISIGRYPDQSQPGTSALSLRSMVLKTDAPPTLDDTSWFCADGRDYVSKGHFAPFDSGSTRNALLRMSPDFITDANPVGLIGGPGDRFADMVWTPVHRDYALKRGYMYLPPLMAKFFKFEFTQLVAEHYESFVPIRRTINLFSPQTVEIHRAATAGSSDNPLDAGPGVQTMLDLSDVSRYGDALDILRQPKVDPGVSHTATEALYVYDPVQQARVAALGWIWNFQPWHVGSSAPRFVGQQKHVYEQVTVSHATKTAYFVGLKAITAYRVDYTADVDTPMYVEHFHDTASISQTVGVDVQMQGAVSTDSSGLITSKVFTSQSAVRALQFASVQSDSYPLLIDDGFLADDVSAHWAIYGDATLLRHSDRTITVNRGWYARTYGLIETDMPDYSDLEGHLYAEIEGALPNGLVGGGIESEPVTPSNSGRVYAAAKVAAPNSLTAPVRLEIVSVETNGVLASSERTLKAGEEAVFYVGYTVGSAQNPLLYSAIEGQTYGSLDNTRYRDHETTPIYGDVYVRLAQDSPSDDSFTVKRLSLFDAPMTWEFSVDGGTTWYDAMDVRNNPEGVLTFPTPGTQLCWRLRTYREGVSVSSLAIRPWYVGHTASSRGHGGTHVLGPNRSVVDEYPPLEQDPMWQQSNSPIPASWYRKDPVRPFVDTSTGDPVTPLINRPPAIEADLSETLPLMTDGVDVVVNGYGLAANVVEVIPTTDRLSIYRSATVETANAVDTLTTTDTATH